MIEAIRESKILPNLDEFNHLIAQASIPVYYAHYHADILLISAEEEADQSQRESGHLECAMNCLFLGVARSICTTLSLLI